MQTETESIETVDKKIDALELQILGLKKQLTELRRTRAREEVEDYALTTREGDPVKLSELFQGKEDLLLIHNMGQSCPYCTLWADGFNGEVEHLEDRAGFVVVSPDTPEAQRKFSESRGWRFKMASAQGSTLAKDMGFEVDGDPWPGVSGFHKDPDGKIYRTGKSNLGPGDDFCAVWPLLGLLEDGANGWEPKYRYKV